MQKMIIMRGLPGSGKSTLAKKLATEINAVICSADDFFIGEDGQYKFDPTKIGQAHEACQTKARISLEKGLSIVIDNTNTQKWEMQPYLSMAVELNIEVQFQIPNWTHELFVEGQWNVEFLAQNTTHGVPASSIKAMAARFDWTI